MKLTKKTVIVGISIVLGFILFLIVNPFSNNKPTERTVVTQTDGNQFVQIQPGIFYAGLFASEYEWPNQIGVQYEGPEADLRLKDNTIDIGATRISFLGGPTATVQGIVQFNLPNDEASMLEIHNQHKTVEGLVKLRLAPYTKECLKASAQLMTPEMHYNGGATQMGNEYLDQLQNGVFLLESRKVTVYDSLEKTYKADYAVVKQLDKNKKPLRKSSSVAKYHITIGDGQITNTEYEERIKLMLGKQIDAQSATQLAKQQYITAQQQALTAAAQGQKKLVETEYTQMIALTTQTVQAQTKVDLAKLYSAEQQEAAKAAIFASQKVRTDADAESYKNSRMVSAGLTPQERAQFDMDTKIGVAEAISKTTWPSYYSVGGTGQTNDILNAILKSQLLNQK